MGSEFEARLHQRLEELVRSRVGQLEQDISRLQRELNQSFTSLLEVTDAASSIPESDESVAKIMADVQGQIGEAGEESARLGSDIALLRDAVDELGKQTTQAEVLNTLVERAAAFAARVVLFVVKGPNALGWAAMGLDESLGKNAVRGLSISLQSDTILKAAMDSQQTFYSQPDHQLENSLIIGRLGHTSPDRVLVSPLRVRGKCAALLYADSGDRGDGAVNVEGLELLVSTTGLVVELTSLRTRVTEGGHAAPQPGAAQTATGSLGAHAPVQQPSGELRQQPTRSFFKPAAEAAPAAQSAASQAHAPAESARAAAPARSTPPTPASGEEEKQHNDARRFARLLVSEIKLYNEQKVVEGRNNRDLYDRLKEDIDRSRQMYEKRIAPVVAHKFDYFYDELVNTLAEGDPSKLGSDFPGPSVRPM